MRIAQCLPGTTCKKMTHSVRDQHIHTNLLLILPRPFSPSSWHETYRLPQPHWSSLMASSTFEVLPALEADMGDIGAIFTISFADDHILGPANGNVAPDFLRAADLEFINELWRTREAFNARFFKVVDLDTRSEPETISSLLPILFFSFLSYAVFLFFLHFLHLGATVWQL